MRGRIIHKTFTPTGGGRLPRRKPKQKDGSAKFLLTMQYFIIVTCSTVACTLQAFGGRSISEPKSRPHDWRWPTNGRVIYRIGLRSTPIASII
ncbi:hypothetical protein ASPBRDRAFT_38196 [Aspergillus brasiliensis CBS 101740]|uniref:Uncharacterized protein n=1 Tax=Aspergillus brasiliensis (strain CBS 101740 / IMI 381727 / IBT 21946) TaxID=767769 RepID=A0A1L9UW47_ASPBC|nr:hypothetical protein ASPBRDRAFT_38196 [Aspergillus brasiliensis CBS 101740]